MTFERSLAFLAEVNLKPQLLTPTGVRLSQGSPENNFCPFYSLQGEGRRPRTTDYAATYSPEGKAVAGGKLEQKVQSQESPGKVAKP